MELEQHRAEHGKPNGGYRGDEPTESAVFLALSHLSPAEYDRTRKEEAKRIGISVTALDAEVKMRRSAPNGDSGQGHLPFLADPVPWPEPVDGEEMLDGLCEVYSTHTTLPVHGAEASALFTVLTHCHDAFQISPILGVTSPEKGCGKSTLLMLLGALVRKPLPSSNITPSALFRAVEKFAPTVLCDEADTFIYESEEFRGIINSGWLRSQACVVKSVPVGDGYEARIFSTWSPKVIAQIGKLPDTIRDRSIEIRMRRQTAIEERETRKLRGDRLGKFETVRRKAFCWACDHLDELREHDPAVPEGFSNRLADNWRPFLSIAEVAGGRWGELVRQTALGLTGVREDDSAGVLLLTDLKSIFESEGADRLV